MNIRTVQLLVVLLCSTSVHAREWTDLTGQYCCQADFVLQKDDRVWLRRPEGTTCSIAVDELCPADRAFLADSQAKSTVSVSPRIALNEIGYRPSGADTAMPPFYALPKPDQGAKTPLVQLAGWRHCRSQICCPSVSSCCPVNPCCPVYPCPPVPDSGKRIYKGCKSTFHIVYYKIRSPVASGTVAFWMTDANGCCRHYLALLRVFGEAPGFFIYQSIDQTGAPLPVGGVLFWAIDMTVPSNIWRSAGIGQPYFWYDRDYSEIPQ